MSAMRDIVWIEMEKEFTWKLNTYNKVKQKLVLKV